MLKLLQALVIVVALVGGAARAAPAVQISFSPAQPTSADTVTATLNEAFCVPPPTVQIQGYAITIAEPIAGGLCPPIPPTTTQASLGRLPAGTYSVTWKDNGGQVAATASLVVSAVLPAPAPMLDPLATLAMGLCLAGLAVRALRQGSRARSVRSGHSIL